MLKVISTDNEFYYFINENGEVIISDFTFEFENEETKDIYRVVAYSLQDGTDHVRVSFDLLDREIAERDNNFNENYEEVAYGFYSTDGTLVAESAGCDLEDKNIQSAVVKLIFDHYVDEAKNDGEPNTIALEHMLNFDYNLIKNLEPNK